MARVLRLLAFVLALVWLAPGPAATFAQTRRLPGGAVILGEVVDAQSQRGLDRAVVTVSSQGGGTRTITDANGRFLVKGLPGGEFTVTATRNGFLPGAFGQRRPEGGSTRITLVPGQWMAGVIVPLWRPAVVTGEVVDERGEPIIGTTVRVYRRAITGGRRVLLAAGQDVTDDTGSYRIANLVPGEYLVSVPSVQVTLPVETLAELGRTGTVSAGLVEIANETGALALGPGELVTGMLSGALMAPSAQHMLLAGRNATPPASANGRLMAYPTQYYPASPDAAGAVWVTPVAGREYAAVNFQLRPVPTFTVSGHVESAEVPPEVLGGTQLLLVRDGVDRPGEALADRATARTVPAPDGTFTFLSVPQGDYVLEATLWAGGPLPVPVRSDAGGGGGVAGAVPAPPPGSSAPGALWARVPVSLSNDDVEGLGIALRGGLTIGGRTQFAGRRPRPSADAVSRIPIVLEPVGGPSSLPYGPLRLAPDGTFTTPPVLPGHYVVRIGAAPPGWTLRTVLANGIDISDEPIDLTQGVNVSNVVITFTELATQITGTVRRANGLGNPDGTVLLFPERASGSLNARRFRSARVSAWGTFAFADLPAGNYYVVAVDDAESEGWQAPERLNALRSMATRVTLREGDSKIQDLRLNAVKR